MGKQLSIYLNELETKRLAEIAIRECRQPREQARYFLLTALANQPKEEASHAQTTEHVKK